MRNDLKLGATFVAGIAITLALTAIGGPLDPPAGPVAPTLKTLDEVEPSTPIESLAGDATARHLITQPGAYHLTGNMTAAFAGETLIEVASFGVTIDLRGFNISANGLSDNLIVDVTGSGATGLTVRNGRVSATNNVAILAPDARQALIERIAFGGASLIGGDAVVVGEGSIVRDIRTISGGGVVVGDNSIVQRVVNSRGRETVTAGDGCLISDIAIDGIGGLANTLIQVGDGCTIERVTGVDSRSRAIAAGSATTVRDCSFTNEPADGFDPGSGIVVVCGPRSIVESVRIVLWGGNGIEVGIDSIVRDCVLAGQDDFGVGILAGRGSLVEACSVKDYLNGIDAQASRTLDCSVDGALNIGIVAVDESIVDGCRVRSCGGEAITATFGSVIRNNMLRNNIGGILVSSDTRVEFNQLDGDSITATGNDNVIDSNVITDLTTNAIVVTSIGSTITRNRSSSGPASFNIVAGNTVGTIQTTPVGAGAWDNFAF